MATLTGNQIKALVRLGDIEISPWNPDQIQPASYDVRLHPLLLRIVDQELDFKKEYKTERIIIPEEGYVLQPGELYLGCTVERTKSPYHRPKYDGRSTTGRYFLLSHQTAGYGDPGFDGAWTLEITCYRPIRVYPNMRIGQISFDNVEGTIDTYKGNYNNSHEPKPGRAGNI